MGHGAWGISNSQQSTVNCQLSTYRLPINPYQESILAQVLV